jgi:hypothetical protein
LDLAADANCRTADQERDAYDAAHPVLTQGMAYRACALLLLCLWSPAVGVAQDAARGLFEEGVAFADEAQWPLAVARFRAALAAHPSNVIEFNLGLALTHTNQSIEAIEVLERVADRAGVDPVLRAEASAAAASERLQIAEVEVTYAGSTEGVTLRVDGVRRPIAQLHETMRFQPGTHTILLERAGEPIARNTLRLTRGGHTRVVLEDTRASSSRPALPRLIEPASSPRESDTNLWLGLGIGGGVLVTIGAVTLAVVLTSSSSPSPYGGSLGTVEINR